MRRILTVFFVVVLTLALLIFLISRGGEVTSLYKQGQSIVTLILTVVQLIGIAVAFGLLIFILIQYIQYSRPNRFVFEGFSNTSSLTTDDQMPLDLNIFAREELIYQFGVLNSEWGALSGDTSSDADALFTDGEFFGQIQQKLEYNKYIPAEFTEGSQVLGELKAVIESVKDSEGINLMALAEEIAPKEATPIMKFVEAIVPPHIIRATGHLQWQADKEKKERAGITFEFVDLGNRRNLMVRTIWWKPEESEQNATRFNPQQATWGKLEDMVQPNQVSTDQKQPTASEDDEKSQATSQYIDLLDPTMHWLALMFWKQKMLANTPPLNYFRKGHERRRQAQILYLFGAMFYACIDQFQKHRDFFCQLAIEHFRKASIVDPKWCSPLLYLADLYSFKMQQDGEKRQKLFNKAIELYDQASKRAESMTRDPYILHQITIAKALAELVSQVEEYVHAAFKEIKASKKKLDPASFDPGRADCSTYLYNLALWHAYAARWYPAYIREYQLEARQLSRRYVAYCLARSKNQTHFEDLWNAISNHELFQYACGVDGLNSLKVAIEAKRKEEARLADLRDGDFERAINDILGEVFKEVNKIG